MYLSLYFFATECKGKKISKSSFHVACSTVSLKLAVFICFALLANYKLDNVKAD